MALMVLLAFVPLLYPQIPPLVDIGGHMGRYKVAVDLAGSPILQQWFSFHWLPIGNLGVDLLVVPLAKLIGAHRDSCAVYNTSGGFLQASVEEIKEKATASLESGIGGIKIKVGQPDWREDLRRVAALREHLGDGPFMVDANQQWDRARARRMCRELEQFDLVWIEEPLDAWDHVGHADLSQTFDTPVATGEMLTSVAEHMGLVDAGYRGIVQPDAPRIGGITPFLRFATLAAHHRLDLAPHYAMEIHLHLAATYPTEPWVEHFEWLNPLFEERIDIRDGQIFVPDRPGLGFTLTERMRELTVETATFSA